MYNYCFRHIQIISDIRELTETRKYIESCTKTVFNLKSSLYHVFRKERKRMRSSQKTSYIRVSRSFAIFCELRILLRSCKVFSFEFSQCYNTRNTISCCILEPMFILLPGCLMPYQSANSSL